MGHLRRNSRLIAGLLGLTLTCLPAASAAYGAKGTGGNQKPGIQAGKYRTDELIVKYKDPGQVHIRTAGPTEHMRYSKKRSIKKARLDLLQLPSGETMDNAMQSLKSDPYVEYVQPNYHYYKHNLVLPGDPLYPQEWGMHNTGQAIQQQRGVSGMDIHAPEAQAITKGSPQVTVAIIDGGVDFDHPDLIDAAWTNPGEIPGNGADDDGDGFADDVHGWDFYNQDGSVYDSGEDDAHATHIAGVIAGAINNQTGIGGLAPNVKIMSLKFFGPDGGDTMMAVDAINYAKSKGAKVINASWGAPAGGSADQALEDAIQNSGAVFVAAAGNDSSNNDQAEDIPSGLPCSNIISVAAVDNRGALASFSNYGQQSVDIGAPGVDILSTLPAGFIGTGYSDAYGFMSGTSMAAPFVAGTAAMIYSQNPIMTPEEVIKRMMDTARPLSSLKGKTVSGGMVDAYAALQAGIPNPPDLTGYQQLKFSTSSDAPLDKIWKVTFSTPLAGSSINAQNVFVKDDHSRNVPVTVTLNAPPDGDGKAVSIKPTNGWQAHTAYYVFLKNQIQSTTGKAMKQNSYFTFATH